MGLPLPVLILYVGLSWLCLAGVHFPTAQVAPSRAVRSVLMVDDYVAPCGGLRPTPRHRLTARSQAEFALRARFTSLKNQIARVRQMLGRKQPAVIIRSEGAFIMRLRWARGPPASKLTDLADVRTNDQRVGDIQMTILFRKSTRRALVEMCSNYPESCYRDACR